MRPMKEDLLLSRDRAHDRVRNNVARGFAHDYVFPVLDRLTTVWQIGSDTRMAVRTYIVMADA